MRNDAAPLKTTPTKAALKVAVELGNAILAPFEVHTRIVFDSPWLRRASRRRSDCNAV